MRASLTPMQIKVYGFIRQYRSEHGTVPTNQEIATGVETTSANAHRIIKGLTARGYIIPGPPRTWRSYTLVEDHENVNPMMGVHSAAADFVRKHRAFMDAVESGQDTEDMGHEVQQALKKLTVEVGENV
jgi:SOS-response transcriptional repressor LexA